MSSGAARPVCSQPSAGAWAQGSDVASAGWMDLELVVVPVVESPDWLRMKRISLFIGKGKNCSRIAKHFVLEEMSLF